VFEMNSSSALARIDRGRTLSESIPVELDWRVVASRWLNTKSSERTRSVYMQALSEFFAISGIQSTDWLTGIGLAHLTDFGRALSLEGNGSRTIALKTSAVRGFFTWLSALGLIRFSPDQIAAACPSPKFDKRRKDSFDTYDLASLREYFASTGVSGNTKSERDRLVIVLLIHTGCRVGELVNASVGDVMTREGFPFLRVTGKGNKTRDIDLSKDVYFLIRDWWQRIGICPAKKSHRKRPLIERFTYAGEHILQPGKPVTARAVQYLVKAILKRAGIEKPFTPHSARHTCARMMVKAGASAFDVQARLGHASVATANEYVTERDAVAEQINRFAPGV